ncbi:uncharacterized protein LOC143257479 [Tachypleus tridentatus]|uniref:uncharacterized protein LOC143257479 n=1 Tax=Tachypleus tridentatus TaxID=6853 RepID=UPI003FCEF293
MLLENVPCSTTRGAVSYTEVGVQSYMAVCVSNNYRDIKSSFQEISCWNSCDPGINFTRNMADVSPFTLEERIVTSTWVHERKNTGDTTQIHWIHKIQGWIGTYGPPCI